MTNEMMMIPTQEFERLQDFYKGQISQSALLNKAGRLAAEKHLILKNPKIPDAMAVKMVKNPVQRTGSSDQTESIGKHFPGRSRCPDPSGSIPSSSTTTRRAKVKVPKAEGANNPKRSERQRQKN